MAVTLKPNLAVAGAQAQAIVDRAAAGHTATRISELQGGEISTVFEIELADGPPNLVLKVYPDSMHWKMRKEVTVSRLLEGRLSVPAPRVILADDTKVLLDLNFLVMTKLDGKSLLTFEAGLDKAETKTAGLLAGYGTIERPHWQQTLVLYQFYCVLELWCWWTMIGDHQRAANIMADLERYA